MRAALPIVVVTLALLGVVPSVRGAGERDEGPPIAVVVGRSSDLRGVTVDDLREIYLRRRRVWPNGRRVIPVNLPPDHPLRDRFSRRVLGRATRDLVGYWNRRYLEGVQPPLVLKTPQAVCAYLAVEPDAIGYVPRAEADEAGCRVLLTLPDAER